MAEEQPPLKIRNFQHALEMAKEFEVDGFMGFESRYGQSAVIDLLNFFEKHFRSENLLKAQKFVGNVFGLSGSYGFDFFYALKAVGELPVEFEPILRAKMIKTRKVQPLIVLRTAQSLGGKAYGLIPDSVLPRKTNVRPLYEQVKIIDAASRWALRNVPLEKLQRRLEQVRNQPKRDLFSDVEVLNKFITEKKRFMSRQRLRQRQLRVKKGKGSLKPKRGLRK